MISSTQTLQGVLSTADLQKNHYLFFDMEGVSLEDVEIQFKTLQKIYNLSNIYIVSDHEKSFHVYCFNKMPFLDMVHILTDKIIRTGIDGNFIHWTMVRGEATLRTSPKAGRKPQKVVSVLESYPLQIPKSLIDVEYDTGIEKSGILVSIEKGKARIHL
jgi:hypothetical protein